MSKTISKVKQHLYNIEVFKNRKGQFCFRKNHDNGNQISKSSESYATKQKCLQGLKADSMITIDAAAITFIKPIFLVYLDKTTPKPSEKLLKIK